MSYIVTPIAVFLHRQNVPHGVCSQDVSSNYNPTAHRSSNLQLRVRTARDTTCATALTCPPGQHVADATAPGDAGSSTCPLKDQSELKFEFSGVRSAG